MQKRTTGQFKHSSHLWSVYEVYSNADISAPNFQTSLD